jgi:hypothetical protein
MVIQGRNAKNKESVSVKILLNHVQMLALLSGTFSRISFFTPEKPWELYGVNLSWDF